MEGSPWEVATPCQTACSEDTWPLLSDVRLCLLRHMRGRTGLWILFHVKKVEQRLLVASFSVTVTNYLTKGNLGKPGFIFGSQAMV